jgi:hypothetical protein
MSIEFCLKKRKVKKNSIRYLLFKSPKSLKRASWVHHRTEADIEDMMDHVKIIGDSWLIKEYKFKVVKQIINTESDVYDPKELMLKRIEWGF